MFAAELELLAAADDDPAFASSLPRDGFKNLRKGIAAGSSVPEPLMRRLMDRLGLEDLVICYGMTETAPVSCMTSPSDPPARRARTVGRAMPHTALKVVSPHDRTKILPRGERGELAAAGYLVMQGYYGDPERTAEDLVEADGDGDGRRWMYTGDEARMDEDGFVEVTGRIKDLIIRGGENIHPLEIESAIMGHPRVREASVVGVPDERYGEVVGAFVATHDGVKTVDDEVSGGGGGVGADAGANVGVGGGVGADGEGANGVETEAGGGREEAVLLSKDEVRDWVRKNLSGHLVPKYVFWMDEFPKTASGKIQKFKLRELAKELVARGK